MIKAKKRNWEWEVSRMACQNIARSVLALDVSDVKISDDLQARVDNIFLNERYKTRKRKLRRRIAVVLVAAVILALTACVAIPTVRKKLYKIVITHCGEFFSYSSELIETDEAAQALDDFMGDSKGKVSFEKRVPAYIPEGYELYLDDLADHIGRMYYYSTNDQTVIHYEQSLVGTIRYKANSKSVKLSEIAVNESRGFVAVECINNITNITLIWNDGEYDYLINATLTLDEILKIAESIP